MNRKVRIVEVGPRDGLQNEPGEVPTAVKLELIERLADGALLVRLDGRACKARAVRAGEDWHVFCNGDYRRFSLAPLAAEVDDAGSGSLAAPMPGKIVKVLAQTGAQVAKGDALLILEAMKMEHTITAPAAGRVKEIHYGAGEQVLEGAELITLE